MFSPGDWCELSTVWKYFFSPTLLNLMVPSISRATYSCCKTCVLVYFLTLHDRPENVGWDNAVVIATCYGMDGLGIKSQWGARFSTPVQTFPRAHLACYPMSTGSFPGGTAAWVWHWQPTPIWRWSWRNTSTIPLLPFWAFVVCSSMNFTLYFYCLENDKCSLYQNSLGHLQHTMWVKLESQNYALHTSHQSLRARICV
jgi:hypothetical protein